MPRFTFTPLVTLTAESKAKLRKIINDPKAANKFIKAAERALTHYRAARELNRTVDTRRERAGLKAMQAAAQKYSRLLNSAAAGSVLASQLRQGLLLSGKNANLVQQSARDAAAIAAGARKYLEATRPVRGGRHQDGATILLIQDLANAFNEIDLKASAGDRSKFVRAVEAFSLPIADVRQVVRGALAAG